MEELALLPRTPATLHSNSKYVQIDLELVTSRDETQTRTRASMLQSLIIDHRQGGNNKTITQRNHKSPAQR